MSNITYKDYTVNLSPGNNKSDVIMRTICYELYLLNINELTHRELLVETSKNLNSLYNKVWELYIK